MSPHDSEFAAYLAARWPVLVRALELLGHDPEQARELALSGLAGVWPEWSRLRREGDVEPLVWQEVLAARERSLRHQQVPVPAAPPRTQPGLPEQAERLAEVVAALAAVTPEERVAVVLAQVAELDEGQLDEVLGSDRGRAPVFPDADVRLALEAIPVDPVAAEEVAARARARRRTTWRRAVAVLAGLVTIAAAVLAVSWVLRPDDGLGEVVEADNPLPIAWSAQGRLHLSDVTVTVAPVVDLVTVPDGVVLADADGGVAMVTHDGTVTPIGSTVPGEGLVVDPDNGWVAWADPGDGAPQLVVHDTRVGDVVGRRSLASPGEGGGQPVGGTGPIAINGEHVYYRTRDTDIVWEPIAQVAISLDGRLVDAAQAARMSQIDGGFLLQAAPYAEGTPVPGSQGRLTADGRYAFVVENDELVVHDLAAGRRVERMYSPSDRALAWSYTAGRFYVAVQHKLQDKTYQDILQMPSKGDYRIFECVPGRADACVELTTVPEDAPQPPVLAR